MLMVAVIGLILTADFRNPKVRRTAFVLTTFFVMLVIFSGINSLNINREIAMKLPRKILPIPRPLERSTELSQSHQTEAASPLSQAEGLPEVPPSNSKRKPVAPSEAPAEKNQNLLAHAPTEGFAVQLVTYASQEDAERLAGDLGKENIRAFVKALSRPNGKTFYCVFLGPYKTAVEAEKSLEQNRKKKLLKPFQDAFVRSL